METPLDESNTRPPEDKKTLGKILLWNFGLMFGVMLLSSIGGADSVIFDLMFMILQVIVNLLLGLYFIFSQRRNAGLAHLLSVFLVVLVGFGACSAKLDMFGGLRF